MDQLIRITSYHHEPWNKGKLVGQKAPLKLKEIWAIRVRLQLGERARQLALFNLAIDSKLRSCDLVKLPVRDVTHGDRIAARAIVMQQKTQRPVQCEITEQTRESLGAWILRAGRRADDYLFPSRLRASPRPGLGEPDRAQFSCLWYAHDAPHQGLPDLSSNEKSPSSATAAWAYQAREHGQYLGIEVDDALEMAEQTEV